jgi:hypothetical protein
MHNHRPPSSRSALTLLLAEFSGGEAASTLPYPVKGSLNLFSIDPRFIRHEPSDCFSVPCDDDFLASLHAIEQTSKGIFGVECADLRSFRLFIFNHLRIS